MACDQKDVDSVINQKDANLFEQESIGSIVWEFFYFS